MKSTSPAKKGSRGLKNSNYIRLDADVFITLWENQHVIPESWKEKVDGKIRYILFNGTVLSDLRGNRNILYLCWRDARWRCGVCWLALDWDASRLSAVLES